MPETRDVVYAGIAGTVLALDRRNGNELWRTGLKGKDFVNVVLDRDKILAATKGELYCLDPATGRILWNNPLKGLCLGLLTMATANAPSGAIAPSAAKKGLDDAQAAAS